MIKKTLIPLLAALVLLLSCGSTFAEPPETETFVKLESGTQYEISNASDKFVVRLPFTLQTGVKAVKPLLVDVAAGERHDQALAKLFTVAIDDADDANRTPALTISVDTKNLKQGKYKLLIVFQPVVDSASAVSNTRPLTEEMQATVKKQFVNLDLTLPAARLQAPATLIVEQTVYPWSAKISDNSSLLLRETSGHETRLTDLEVKQIEITKSGGGNADNSAPLVSFTSPAFIAPTKAERFPVALAGDFPLGNTPGTALVTSPQLAEPLLVNFEVRARRSAGYIIAVILLGLFFGFFVRIWAQRQIDLYNARSKAAEAIKTLRRELQRRPDAIFQRKIKEVLVLLESAKSGRNIETMATAIASADTESAAALRDLDAQRAAAVTQLEVFSKLAAGRRSLPQRIASVFEIENTLAQARELIALDNVGQARQMLDGLASQINASLRETSLNWIEESQSFLEGLSSLVSFQATVSDNFPNKINALSAKLEAVTVAEDDTATPENVAASFGALREARFGFRRLLLETQYLIANSVDLYRTQFAQVSVSDKVSLDEFFAKLDAFLLKFAEWIQPGYEIPPPSIQADVSNLKAVWREALLKQFSGESEAKVDVGSLLDEEKYREATAATIKFLRGNPAETLLGDMLLGDASSATTGASQIDGMFFPAETTAPAPSIFNIFQERTLPPIFDFFESGSWFSYVIANLLRFIVAGIGIAAAGYVLFADKFVGTASDLLAIFVWAFGLDVSINAFLEASGGKNKT